MSDFKQLDKKIEELKISPLYQDDFQDLMLKDLSVQEERFKKALDAKRKNKELKDRASSVGSVESVESEVQTNEEILGDTLDRVTSFMPPVYKIDMEGETALEEYTESEMAEEKTEMPKEITDLLGEISGWEKVKKNTSLPVKEAAKALKDATNDMDAADAMASLAVACTNYMEKNGSNIFKSGRRKRAVSSLLNSISNFIAQANSIYYAHFELAFANISSEAANEFEERLSSSIMEQESVESVEEAIRLKQEKEKLAAENAEKEAIRTATEAEE